MLNKPSWITVFIRISALPRISAYPSPHSETQIRDNIKDTLFFRVFYRDLALLNLCVLLLPFIALLQNNHTTFAENGENLISTHLELAPTLKVQKFNKRPGRLIE